MDHKVTPMWIGVDTGGTFTDFVFREKDIFRVLKIPSTPSNPAVSVLQGIRQLCAGQDVWLMHGSTVATNAILEKKGALTALITNHGFEDVIEIGRQERKSLYDLMYRRNPPLVPECLRIGIKGRISSEGEAVEDLDDEQLHQIVSLLKARQVESVAVSLLFSFANPEHELHVGRKLAPLQVPVSLSHRILSEFREFERTSTCLLNAYVAPRIKTYIDDISKHSEIRRFRIMQSNGGSISTETAVTEPVRTILSGPAGGVTGAFKIGKTAGYSKLITFDMGGTSTDVALIDNRLPLTVESSIDGFPVKVPMIAIHTVGAGGGSIACFDSGGSLKVGPESAGADPGPVCYGRGDRLTVTDANLYLGRLIPQCFMGGDMALYPDRLTSHFRAMAKATGLDPVQLAEGILDVANTAMERAIRVISVEKGFDPRDFAMLSFGGAGGMHAAFLARLLNMSDIIIPLYPGALSAVGMLLSDTIKDYSRTVMFGHHQCRPDQVKPIFQELETQGLRELTAEGASAGAITLSRYLDMRYQGQSHEIIVPYDADFISAFHRLHEKNFGYCNESKPVEIVNVRLRATAASPEPDFERQTRYSGTLSDGAVIGEQPVVFDGVKTRTAIISRDKLVWGNCIKGPAIVTEYSSTVVVPPFAEAKVDTIGNLILTIKE